MTNMPAHRPCKARKVKCGEEHPTCINCQRTGEPCDYSVRLNWEGRRTKRSLSLGTLTGITQPFKDSSRTEQPPFNHTFTISNPTQNSDPKPVTKRVLTAPVGVEAGKRKLEQLETCDDYLSFQNTSSRLIQHQNGALFAPPRSAPKYNARDHSSTSSLRRIFPATANASSRLYKRSKSLAETGQPDILSQYGRMSSPISLIGQSSPTSFLTSGAISTSTGSPLTPVSLVIKSDDETRLPALSLPSPASPEDSRLSVNYLISSSSRVMHGANKGVIHPSGPPLYNSECKQDVSEEATFYGFDLGIPDADIAQNDDTGSISSTASSTRHSRHFLQAMCGGSYSQQSGTINGTMPRVWYYGQPIPIWIPRSIEPIPAKLRENPMNILRQHHFLNHTARVLVPYDDPQSNPFRTILPQMAVGNDHLLSLLLAYSAAHRSRLLGKKEPQMRIAIWVQDIFPALRQALNDRDKIISNTSLATAIMLASLEIISPTAFGFDIPWQRHLNLARTLMWRRLADLRRSAENGLREDSACAFLWSWFAYLDVLGSLSGGGVPDADSSRFWLLEYTVHNPGDSQDEIDCVMGFTTRCVQILAQIAELARRCDEQRFALSGSSPQLAWYPNAACVERAQLLEQELFNSMAQPSCPSRHNTTINTQSQEEIAQLNEAFHWAGLVHLHRRILGKPPGHEDVQGPVGRIVACLEGIAPGGSAETGFLFPMFTAGCHALERLQRSQILERFQSVERNGMTQVSKARVLMENVWLTGQPWEPLLCTEFIG
ncbi:cyclophilin type peptidyl-prolyl cis-trans isomerase/CLD [Colletotrichum abscissum]|uniref:Cyclophilin type peptidyl-prolyl cis-trans isomerase/CLD n=1 Tax=Colletotrichum abscissum TaxID=1671311 RepID=A0A9P9XLG7_9PEZI|nr:cyclophilin type peptidyl-prolyl cis-trans isomerase/CLD [Colletotrichum abscissum]